MCSNNSSCGLRMWAHIAWLAAPVTSLCPSYHCHIYPYPSTPEERRSVMEGLKVRIQDLHIVSQKLRSHSGCVFSVGEASCFTELMWTCSAFVCSALKNKCFRPRSLRDNICVLQLDLFSFRILFIVLEILRHSSVFRTLIVCLCGIKKLFFLPQENVFLWDCFICRQLGIMKLSQFPQKYN